MKYLIPITIVLIVAFDLLFGFKPLPPIYYIPSTHYHHDLSKNFRGQLIYGKNQYMVFTNSLGFKDNSNRKVPLVSDKYRILFIGDSFTEGVGLPYDDTFAGIIAKHLDRFDILNAAVQSYSTKLYYLKVKYLIEHGLKFDELAIFMDNSDPYDDIEYEKPFPDDSDMLNLYLRQHSVIVRKFFHKPKIKDNRHYEITEDALQLAEKYMNNLYDLCRSNKIRLTVAVYPYNENIINAGWPRQVKFWEDFCAKRGIPFLNYYPLFTDTRYSFSPEDSHWNREGHKFVAKKWLEYNGLY